MKIQKTIMSKVVEKMLTSIKAISYENKSSYLNRQLDQIKKEDLKTLDEVLVERRTYFDNEYNKDRTNKDIIQTITTIDDIRIIVNERMPKTEGEKY